MTQIKRNAPLSGHSNGAKGKNTYLYFITKKRLSKAQKSILQDFFGSLLLLLMMGLLVVLILIVGVDIHVMP